MNGLIAVGYPNTMAANEALTRLSELQSQMIIELDDAVIVERQGDGRVKLHQTTGSTTGRGAAGGALWGGLIGLLFFAPLLGMAIGAGTGALAGKAVDTGIDDNFMTGLGERLQPGAAALVLLVRSATVDKVLHEMHGQYGGEVLQTSLSSEDEAALRAAAERARMAT
ncbi:MAG TPA: DUF1269 domain-containing protein [Micromonosporaceae bacterium]|nr:DUF1269 domain-containing protein [Micromonosporaceae bacterium]